MQIHDICDMKHLKDYNMCITDSVMEKNMHVSVVWLFVMVPVCAHKHSARSCHTWLSKRLILYTYYNM